MFETLFWRNLKITLILLSMAIFPGLVEADIYTLKINGPIESITAEYVRDSFKQVKNSEDVTLVIIEIDTPGGFDTSMRSIIKDIMGSPVPVAVYVSPRGARAASAGFFITICADIACMAPGTNMGAAHPVAVGGGKVDKTMAAKMTNDAASYVRSLAKSRNRNMDLSEKAVRDSASYTAQECLQNGLIEYTADDRDELIKKLDGKHITMLNGQSVPLQLKGKQIVELDMTARQKFLKTITNPNLAYFLLIFGLLGLYLEFSHPGILVPGILGGISLLLAFLAFQVLPINYIGLLLILLSIGLFIAEIKIQGFGILGVGGIVSFVLGSVMLIDTPIPALKPSLSTILGVAAAFGAIFLFLTFKVIKAMKNRTVTGKEAMVGEIGKAKTDIDKNGGKVFVHGEWWNAITDTDQHIPNGSKIVVKSIENFVLTVSLADSV